MMSPCNILVITCLLTKNTIGFDVSPETDLAAFIALFLEWYILNLYKFYSVVNSFVRKPSWQCGSGCFNISLYHKPPHLGLEFRYHVGQLSSTDC